MWYLRHLTLADLNMIPVEETQEQKRTETFICIFLSRPLLRDGGMSSFSRLALLGESGGFLLRVPVFENNKQYTISVHAAYFDFCFVPVLRRFL